MKMILWRGHTTSFHDENHQYYFDGEKVRSTTQAMEVVGIRKPMPDTEFIRQRAEFGTFVHNEIDEFEKNRKSPLSAEARFWVKYGHPLADKWDTEVMFGNKDFAGTCDAIGRNADGSIILVDHKTGNVDEDLVSWQLSIYWRGLVIADMIPEHAPCTFLCYDAKGDDGRFIEIGKKSDEEFERFMKALKSESTYIAPSMPLTLPTDALVITDDEKKQFYDLLAKMPLTEVYDLSKRLSKQIEAFETGLKKTMQKSGETRAKTKDGYLWTISQYEQTSFSKDEMFRRYPKLGPRIYKNSKVAKVISKLSYKGKEVTDDKT